MTGIFDCGVSSTTIEVATRLLKYLHDGRDLAALLLFKYLDRCSYQIAGHVTAPQLGTTKNVKVLARQFSDCPRYQRRESAGPSVV